MKPKNNLRIDKNIAYNIIEINKVEDIQTQIIIKSLLVYFSFSYQSDLFGYGRLDPYDFAKKTLIDKDLLFKRHPNPKYIQDSNLSKKKLYEREKNNDKYDSETRVWDNYLENALYILVTTPLFEHYKGSTGNKDFIGLRNHLLLREIQLFPVKVNKGRVEKLYYKYKLDEYFESNLRKFFLQIDFDSYRESRRKNVDALFLAVMNIYNTYKHKGLNQHHWKLDELLAYFSISPELHIKFQKQKLNVQLRKLEAILSGIIPGIKFDWTAGTGQRWKYVPVLTWDKVDIEKEKSKDYDVLEDVFLKHLRKNLYEIYLNQFKSAAGNDNDFYLWLRSDKNKDIKVPCYIATYSIYKKITFPSPSTFANQFFNSKIANANSIQEIEDCFYA
jgi:hypothetical protein